MVKAKFLPTDSTKVTFVEERYDDLILHRHEVEVGEARLMLLDCLVDPSKSYNGCGSDPASVGKPSETSMWLYDPAPDGRASNDLTRNSLVRIVGLNAEKPFFPLVYGYSRWLLRKFEDQGLRDRDAQFDYVLNQFFTAGRSLTRDEMDEIKATQPDLYGRFVQFYLVVRNSIEYKDLNWADWLSLERVQQWAVLEGTDDRRQFLGELFDQISEAFSKELKRKRSRGE